MHRGPKLVDIAGDQRDEAHRDGAANSVAAGCDEHAEVRGEHQAELIVGKLLAERMGEPTGDGGRGVLQRKVDPDVEDVGDGVDEPHQADGKQRSAKQPRTPEQQHNPGGIAERNQRVRWDEDRPGRREDEFEDGVIAQMHQRDGEGEDRQTPPCAAHLPAQRAPDAQNEHQAGDGNKAADGLQRIGGP